MIRFTGMRGKVAAIAATAAVAVSALALSHAGTAHGTATRAASVAAGSTAVSHADQVAASSRNGSVSNNGAGATVYDYPGSGTPDTSLAALGILADGTQVSIQCYLTGAPVTGPNGQGPGNSDAYWDQVAGASTGLPGQVPAGHAAVIPDAYIDTGSKTVDQLVPACGAGPGPEASPAAGGSPASAGAGNPAADPPAALQNPNTVSGCTDWPTTKYLQTPLVSGSAAVGGNAYGQGDHTRCNSTSFINQYYAVDVEVPDGTPLRAPGGAGTVLWAGPAPGGWASCGNEVVMNYGGGYWSVQCHLGTIYAHTGQTTNNDTVIALSGNSGLNPANGQPWGPHLHFALFKGASMTPNGGVYGGQSAKAHHMRYFAGGGGSYEDLDYNDLSNGLTIGN